MTVYIMPPIPTLTKRLIDIEEFSITATTEDFEQRIKELEELKKYYEWFFNGKRSTWQIDSKIDKCKDCIGKIWLQKMSRGNYMDFD